MRTDSNDHREPGYCEIPAVLTDNGTDKRDSTGEGMLGDMIAIAVVAGTITCAIVWAVISIYGALA